MLRRGKRRRGIFLKLPSTEVVEVAAASGLDFAVVDLEHSQLTEADAGSLLRYARALGFPALVRLPEVDRGLVNRLLEAGASGIQLSTVTRADQVTALRDAMRYAPSGSRSISLAHGPAGYGATALPDYLARQEAQPPQLVAQIETATTHDPLEEILAAGADVVFIGMVDLSVALGLDRARIDARVEEIAAAAQAADVELGAFGLDDDRVTYELAGSDLALLAGAVRGLATAATHA